LTTAVSQPATRSTGLAAGSAAASRPPRALGWAAAAAITASVLLMVGVLASGPSFVVPAIPRAWPGPLWLPLHLSAAVATVTTYVAIVLGGAGVVCGLVAVRRGCRPSIRLLLAGAVVAVVVLALLPPGGSTDSLSYAAYGRIAALGRNPYVLTPAWLRAIGDPIGLHTTDNWIHDPSLYGPVATAVNWAAAKLGGTSISAIIFWLKLVFAASFIAVAVTLDRVLRHDPAARARAHLLWTVNPLMLWAVVAGAHADGLGAALGIIGILVARTTAAQRGLRASGTTSDSRASGTTPTARIGVARALAAGVLVGAAVGIKAPLFPLGLGLAWSARRSIKDLLAVAAGGVLVLGTGYLIAGWHAVTDLWATGNSLVTFDSFWRLFYQPFGYTSEPAGLELLAALVFVTLAALLARRLPPGPAEFPAVRPALVLMVAWLLAWPLQRPWYDAAAFCLMAVFTASRLDWLMLARAVPAALAVVVIIPDRHIPLSLVDLINFLGYGLSRYVRLGVVIVAVVLCAAAAWERRRPGVPRVPARQAVPS
jgi:hypothetical protein